MFKSVVMALAVLVAGRAAADEFDGKHGLSTDDKAAIELDRDNAHQAIEDKYKGDNSASARSAKAQEYNDADQKVLSDHGVDDRTYRLSGMKSSPDDNKAVETKKGELKTKREKEAKAKKDGEKPAEEGQVEVIKGFDDEHPLNLDNGAPRKAKKHEVDADGNPMPTIEKGFSEDEMNAKAGGDAQGGDPQGKTIEVPPEAAPQ